MDRTDADLLTALHCWFAQKFSNCKEQVIDPIERRVALLQSQIQDLQRHPDAYYDLIERMQKVEEHMQKIEAYFACLPQETGPDDQEQGPGTGVGPTEVIES